MKWLLRDAERLKEHEEEESHATSPSPDNFDLCQGDLTSPVPVLQCQGFSTIAFAGAICV